MSAVESGAAATPASSSLQADDVTSSDGHASKPSKSLTVQIREPPVSESSQLTSSGQQRAVVWSEQKHGPLHRAIPSMPMPLAVIACILNIILPGTGCRLSILLTPIFIV